MQQQFISFSLTWLSNNWNIKFQPLSYLSSMKRESKFKSLAGYFWGLGTPGFSVCTGVFKWVFVLFCFVSYLEVQTVTAHWALPRTLGALLETQQSQEYLRVPKLNTSLVPIDIMSSPKLPISLGALASPWMHFRSNIAAQPQVARGVSDVLEYPNPISSKALYVPPHVCQLYDDSIGFLWDLKCSNPTDFSHFFAWEAGCSSHSSRSLGMFAQSASSPGPKETSGEAPLTLTHSSGPAVHKQLAFPGEAFSPVNIHFILQSHWRSAKSFL